METLIGKFLVYKHNGQLIHPEIIKDKISFCKALSIKMSTKLVKLLADNVSSCNLN